MRLLWHMQFLALETCEQGPVAGCQWAASQRVTGRVFETPGLGNLKTQGWSTLLQPTPT